MRAGQSSAVPGMKPRPGRAKTLAMYSVARLGFASSQRMRPSCSTLSILNSDLMFTIFINVVVDRFCPPPAHLLGGLGGHCVFCLENDKAANAPTCRASTVGSLPLLRQEPPAGPSRSS